ncbi:MAG: hypothetical protein J1E95_02020 [Muribaculaceae bacterium]|nr:hypothetical protein [Muribaculaceae bacterium]
MGVFSQIIILLAVLAAMFMVLLAIRQLARFEHFDDEEETSRLKKELKEEDRILSRNNIFHNLVDPDDSSKTPRNKISGNSKKKLSEDKE